MFVQNLTKAQQIALLSFSNKLIRVDGKISGQEQKLLHELKSQCKQGVEFDDKISFDDLDEIFPKMKQKVSFVLELIGMAKIDRRYTKSERNLIEKISNRIGLSESLLYDMENWVDRQVIHAKEAEILMRAP